MIVNLRNTSQEITRLSDLQVVAQQDHGWLDGYTVKSCSVRRYKLLEVPLHSVFFSIHHKFGKDKKDEFYLDKPLLFVEGERELYVQCDSVPTTSGLDTTPQHPTQFPLAWHEKECGFNVKFRVPTKGPKNVIEIYLKVQNGEETVFRVDDRMLVEEVQVAYCERKGCSLECMRFLLDGEDISGASSSLREHDLESGDQIDAFLSQRGGMYHLSSGRNGFQKLGQPNSMSVNIKYGPDESDIFTMEVSGDDTKESLLKQIRERIDAIRNLQHQIETPKRGGGPTNESTRPNKQHRTGHEPVVAVKKEEISVYDLETDGSSNEQEGDLGE